MAEAVRIIGLKEMSRDFKRLSRELSDELVDELKHAAEKVADDAEHLALTEIRNMPRSPRWAGMRIGVSRAQGAVYVVPAARSRRRPGLSRPNLGTALLAQMEAAVDRRQGDVVNALENMLDGLENRHGF